MDYSDLMKNINRERSLAAGRPQSRLPKFTPAEVARIKGTHDYFGFNHYTAVLAYNMDYKNLEHYDADRGAGTVADRTWLDSGSFWLKGTPVGFRKILNFIKEEYGAYLLDGVDIRGYAAWTLMDNLEWATGFDEKFGFFYKSVWHYATIINCNGFISPGESPHECQIHEPEGSTPPLPLVSFLGLEVSGTDAELSLNVLFSLTIIAAVAVVLLVYGIVKTSKKQKRPVEEHIDLEKKGKF
uniref:Uncharacterized protein n=1 Tax=Sinocyclocheilus grahami TaxID=75366 RepID=A0A672PX40_SINGR